jgi:hypothetical protein
MEIILRISMSDTWASYDVVSEGALNKTFARATIFDLQI